MTPGHDAGRPADGAGEASSSIADLLRLDSVCDAFEESWKAGSRPRLEEYLGSTNLPSATLFVELVQIDIDYRRRHGERPSVDEYAEQFPQFEDALSEIASLVGVSAATVSVPVKPLPMLGRFELRSELGRGSFGVVWKAWDTKMRRTVALKQFHEGIARGNRTLYEREARSVAQLDHPNVVRVLELSEGTASDYIVFELIEGESLKSWLAAREGKPVDPKLAAQIVLQIAQGLQHVHERDIVHRDLKPGNILITKEGVPKLVDFGLARHLDSVSTIAHDKTLLGTIPYMSPEQCRSEKVTAATDIYSLGVVLYELLAGRRPFAGPQSELLAQIQYRTPPPLPVKDTVSADLERICRRALEKETRDRYPRAAEMAADLQRVLSGASPARPPVPYRKYLRRWWNIRTGVGVAGAALLAFALASGQGVDDGTVRVRMATEPPGASVSFIPLGAADGRPRPRERVAAPTASPVDLRLPPGDYLVVAQVDDDRFAFHEVYRHVPRDSKVYRGSQAHLSWKVESDGVTLPSVKLPAAAVTQSMAVVDSAERFKLRDRESKSDGTPQFCSIPSFYTDRQEYTQRQFKERMLQVLGPTATPKAVSAFQPTEDDVNAKTLSWDEAVAEAEASGKRLLHEWEFELVATARGTSRYPWGSDLPVRELATERPGPVGVPAFDKVLVNGSAIVGLGSNVVEWVDADVSLTPRLKTLDGFPLNTIGDKRVVMGGNPHCFDPDPAVPRPVPEPGMRSIVSRYMHHPGVGFRSARSVRPRLQEDDFVRLLRPTHSDERGP